MTTPPSTRTPAEVLAEVAALSCDTAEEAAAALGMTPGRVAQALHDAGRPDIARPFQRAAQRARRARWAPQ